jgi:hypothetical protein
MSYGQYRAVLDQSPPGRPPRAFLAHYGTYTSPEHLHGALSHCRDWFHARARGYKTTLDAALHGNAIPRWSTPDRGDARRCRAAARYHKLRRKALLDATPYDFSIPIVEWTAATTPEVSSRS